MAVRVRDDQGKLDSLPGVPAEKIDGYLTAYRILCKTKQFSLETAPIVIKT